MLLDKRFNLIDEQWIPIVNVGKISLRQVFLNFEYSALGGNPIQKIALTKFLLAIMQAAYTPIDEKDWASLSIQQVAKKCLDYLEKWYDKFWLYGDQPFLQFPVILKAKKISYGALLPECATGNTTILNHSQKDLNLEDSDRALLLITQMGFCLGGKKADNTIILSSGYSKKSTSCFGSSLGYMGFIHHYLQAESLLETLWLNIFTSNQIDNMKIYPKGLGIPPWEKMPISENCDISKALKESYLGRLIPLSRFILCLEKDVCITEGIKHFDYKEGVYDPSSLVYLQGKKIKVEWTDPEKRPWRNLSALLGFLSLSENKQSECFQIRLGFEKLSYTNPDSFKIVGIWAGGLKVSFNAGEQYVSGFNDYVDSSIFVERSIFGEIWFNSLRQEIGFLEQLSRSIYSSVKYYFEYLGEKDSSKARLASNLFWELAEREFLSLLKIEGSEDVSRIRKKFLRYRDSVFNQFCPNVTARQIEAWSKTRPYKNPYLIKD